ncbi:MAG: calcium/sodium antiporter [Sphingomonadales bacterium]
MIAFFQLLGGLVLLIYAGDALVRGAVSLSRRFDIPPMIVGLTVVAFGTSAPELVVGIDAVLTGVPTLALGNVVGSNIANIWLVVGLPALIAPMICNAEKCRRNMFTMLGVTVLFIGLAFTREFNLWTAFILLGTLGLFLYFSTTGKSKNGTYEEILDEIEGLPVRPDPFRLCAILLLAGIVGLSIGAHFFVLGAVDLAFMLGVPEAVIGLTLVALGTSIPELVTAIAASMRRHCDVAIGNILGSNIFNLLAIIGISSLFGDIPVPQGFLDFDLWIMLLAALTFLPFAFFGKNVGRFSGLMFCAAYVFYVILLASGASGIEYLPPTNMGVMP